MWPIKTLLLVVGFVGACALSIAYPIVGIVNYMMVYQCNPHWWWWGKPISQFGIRYSMTAAVCLIAGMVVSSARIPKSRVLLGDWMILLIVFTMIIALSGAIGTGTVGYGWSLIDKTVKMAVFLYCFVRMGGSRRNFKFILWALVFGTLMIGNDAYHANIDQFVDGRLNSIGGVDFRESSGLGAHMSAMLPLLGVALLSTRSWKWKPIILVAAVLAANTIVQCRTRSAFIGLGAGAVVAVMLAPKGWRKRIYALMIIAAIGAYHLTDGYFWERMQTVMRPADYGDDSAIQARLELWQAAWLMFKDHPLGVGVGQYKHMIAEYDSGELTHAFGLPRRVTHNTYLLCATELGFHGFLVFVALLALSLLKTRACIKLAGNSDDPRESRLFAYGCLLAMVVYLVASAFTDRLYTESFWWIVALPVCLERALLLEVRARQLANQPAERPLSAGAFAPAPRLGDRETDDMPPTLQPVY
jgi:O-antigen ligase